MAALPILNAFALEDAPVDLDALDEYLATGPLADDYDETAIHPAIVAVHRWRPENSSDAEWAMERLAELEAQRRHLKDQADEWIAKVRHALDQQLKPIDARRLFFTGRLRDWGIRERAEDDRRKTIYLPSGEIATTRGTKPKVDIVDDDEVVAWAAEALDAKRYDLVVKVSYEPLVSQLRKLVAIVPAYACEGCGETMFTADELAQNWHVVPEAGDVEGEDPYPVQCGPVVEVDPIVVLKPLDDEESAPVRVPGVTVVGPTIDATPKPHAL
jgi:hypothetical protein